MGGWAVLLEGGKETRRWGLRLSAATTLLAARPGDAEAGSSGSLREALALRLCLNATHKADGEDGHCVYT